MRFIQRVVYTQSEACISAHGRHWNSKIGRGYEPDIVFEIAKALIDSMPL